MSFSCNQPCGDRHAVDFISSVGLEKLVRPMQGESFWKPWFEARTSILPLTGKKGESLKAEQGDRSKDTMMFSVSDRHGGAALSHLLKKVLQPCLASATANQAGPGDGSSGMMEMIRDV